MKYPEVDDGHVVPAGYLRGFADGQMIHRHEMGSGRSAVRSVKSVGTRGRPYSRERQNGERIDDVEWSIAHLENQVGVLRSADRRYPFSLADRNVIAQFAGLQQVRGPRWFEENEADLDKFIADLERDGLPQVDGVLKEIVAPRLRRDAERFRESTAKLTMMLRSMPFAAAAFMAMHWTLLQFRRPVLVTSDHPVVMWPAHDGARSPGEAARERCGLLETLEVRYPLTAHTCVLMSWVEGPDPDSIVTGNRQQAQNLNAFTKAQADEEWFSLQGTSPPLTDDRTRLYPLAPALYPGYGPETVASSQRRATVAGLIAEMRGAPLTKNPLYPAVVVEER